eukprot:m.109345 g.109345  ORF g.109345 m.109345 type:complete len:60 (+) comp15243_c0_seq1:1111-1290(+)
MDGTRAKEPLVDNGWYGNGKCTEQMEQVEGRDVEQEQIEKEMIISNCSSYKVIYSTSKR